MLFIDGIVCDTKNGTPNEDLRPLCLQAYEKTLKKYHGWMVQQIFNVSLDEHITVSCTECRAVCIPYDSLYLEHARRGEISWPA